MRPVLIKVDKDENVKITLEELKKMIDEAYNNGYADGERNPYRYYWLNYNSVPTLNTISNGTITGAPLYNDNTKYEVTCSQTKE